MRMRQLSKIRWQFEQTSRLRVTRSCVTPAYSVLYALRRYSISATLSIVTQILNASSRQWCRKFK